MTNRKDDSMIASARRKWFALALLLGVQFMVVLDIAIVNVALPSIQTDLGFSQENLQCVFIAGLVVFGAASLISGLAWSEGALIGARALQGLGAAMITPAALSILTTTFTEGKDRNAALGAWGAVGAFGAVAGVLLGGILTDALSWEWIFFVNVPVGLVGFVLAPFLLKESRDARVTSFDAPGAVLVTAGLVTLVYAITQANNNGWGSLETIGLFSAAAVMLAAFLAWERRTAEPPVPGSFFRLRTVVGANVAGLILGTAIFAMFLMLTLYMQQVLGYSAMKTGVAYLAVAGTAIFWSGLAAQLVTRIGVKPVLAIGMTALSAGLVYFTQVSVGGFYLGDLLPGFLLIALGIAALSAIATSTTSDSIGSGSALPLALTDGFQAAFIAAAGVAILGILVALFVVRRSDLERQPQPVAEPAFEEAAA